jgi:hypothetical protein
MAKRPSKSRRSAQRQFYVRRVKKLQRAGLLGPVDTRKKAPRRVIAAFEKYRDVLSGRSQAVKAPDAKAARDIRKKFKLRGRGKTVVIPREKKERYTITKKAELRSQRPGFKPGETIKKVIGRREQLAPLPGEKTYYTIPERTRGAGKLKRRTFSTFDELLYYLDKYDTNFEDIEEYLEVEHVSETSRKGKRIAKKIARERKAAIRRKRQ